MRTEWVQDWKGWARGRGRTLRTNVKQIGDRGTVLRWPPRLAAQARGLAAGADELRREFYTPIWAAGPGLVGEGEVWLVGRLKPQRFAWEFGLDSEVWMKLVWDGAPPEAWMRRMELCAERIAPFCEASVAIWPWAFWDRLAGEPRFKLAKGVAPPRWVG